MGRIHEPSGAAASADLVEAVRTRIGSTSRVAASLLFQGYAAHLFSPALAVAAEAGLVPDLSPARLWWRYIDGEPLHLLLAPARAHHALREPVADLSVFADAVHDTVVAQNLGPFIQQLRTTVSISPRVLWGNAASALAGAARMLAPTPAGPAAHRLARQLIRYPDLAGTGRWDSAGAFRRTTCCLFYRVPGGGYCGDCVLAARSPRPASPAAARRNSSTTGPARSAP
ncbi:MAG: hypothetical protein AUG49_02565 [Catenulispora sp. 13_1_20CM_3_70_7]|nr:MAG: hypothetical protein AUG49_02565 [Catenulispora sp. 13_1_20CM_3_70_7]